MNDKEIMENILITTKGVVDLYMHGTVESATPNVHGTFNTALESAGRAGHPAEARRRQAEVRRDRVRRNRGMRKHPSFYDKRLISETRPVR